VQVNQTGFAAVCLSLFTPALPVLTDYALPTSCERCVTRCVCFVPFQRASLDASDVTRPVFGVFEFLLALRTSDCSRGGTSQNVPATRRRACAGRRLLVSPKRLGFAENVRHTASLSLARPERRWWLPGCSRQGTRKVYSQAFSLASRDSLTVSTRIIPDLGQVDD
jgi:hypothetical protein